jgi:hypothetical protein
MATFKIQGLLKLHKKVMIVHNIEFFTNGLIECIITCDV